MSEQLNLPLGRRLADQGQEDVVRHAPVSAIKALRERILWTLEVGPDYSDLIIQRLPDGVQSVLDLYSAAKGAVFQTLAREKLIRRTGRTRASLNPKARGRLIPEWERIPK